MFSERNSAMIGKEDNLVPHTVLCREGQDLNKQKPQGNLIVAGIAASHNRSHLRPKWDSKDKWATVSTKRFFI